MKDEFKVGDYVAISPDLTFKYDWVSGKVTGKVTGIEEHEDRGTVIVAELPESGEVFFGSKFNFINLGDLDEEEENEDEDEEYEYDEEEDSE